LLVSSARRIVSPAGPFHVEPGSATAMPHGALSLGQLAARLTHLEVRCRRCDRCGRLRLDRLIDQHGADFPGPALRDLLPGDCLKRNASLYERCNVHFPNVPTVF
jgi:hypothetical protein